MWCYIELWIFGSVCSSGPVHSSPGDYAWGPSGLDDIITQMLANLEDSGPPPAKEEKIAEIPKISATAEDIALCKGEREREREGGGGREREGGGGRERERERGVSFKIMWIDFLFECR